MDVKPVNNQTDISKLGTQEDEKRPPVTLPVKDTLESQGSCFCTPFVWIWNVFAAFFKCIFPCLNKTEEESDASKLRKKEKISLLAETKQIVTQIIELLKGDAVQKKGYLPLYHKLSPQARQQLLEEFQLGKVAFMNIKEDEKEKEWIEKNYPFAKAQAQADLLNPNSDLLATYQWYLRQLNINRSDDQKNE